MEPKSGVSQTSPKPVSDTKLPPKRAQTARLISQHGPWQDTQFKHAIKLSGGLFYFLFSLCLNFLGLNFKSQEFFLNLVLIFWVAVISAKNHKRQRRKRQSVTTKREKSQTPKVLTATLILSNLTYTNFGVCDFSLLAFTDWRLRRWRLWFLALSNASRYFF